MEESRQVSADPRAAEAVGPSAVPATDACVRELFLRALGVVHLIALFSLWGQIHGLVGSAGILPVGEFLERASARLGPEAWWRLPTLCWLHAGDGMLTALCATGVGLAVLLILGIAPRWSLVGLWGAYLSLSIAGQAFLSFQWDTLLLETTFCAIWYAPPGIWRRGQPPPAFPWTRWLLWFLAFKLMFLSGATKLLSGDPTWWQGTALNYHYFTQPLPSWVSWYAHHLPREWHRVSLWCMFIVELALPFGILAGRWGRAVFALGTIVLMAAIELTGNFGFFNLLTAVVCLPLLDDAVLGRWANCCFGKLMWQQWCGRGAIPSTATAAVDPPLARLRAARAVGSACVCGVMLFISMLTLLREMVRTQRPDKLPAAVVHSLNFADRWILRWSEPALLDCLAGFRTINGYGLFRVMTTRRPELVIEYSDDGRTWHEYDFRYKPGRLNRPPPVVAPHMPRLDWQMWFAALHPRGHAYWLTALAARILEGNPHTARLMGVPEISAHPPKFVRWVYYEYQFSDPVQKQTRGEWWFRMRHGELTGPLSHRD
jgi:hypothetical protein